MSAKQTATPSASGLIVSYDNLHRFTAKAFQRAGLSTADAATGADVLALTDAWGTFTHGTKSVRGYLRRLKLGGLHPQGKPRLTA
jgi:LDH2 family malate/lactate/ureidoglycolate dehydrogenase